MTKEWKLSFEFMANSFGSDKMQVLHMTTGGKGYGNGAKYGDQTPAIWTHPSKGILVSSAVNDKVSFGRWLEPIPPTGKWIYIEIGQQLLLSEMTYYIIIDGMKVFSINNANPSEFERVQVLTSSKWGPSVDGSIRNLLIENIDEGGSSWSSNCL